MFNLIQKGKRCDFPFGDYYNKDIVTFIVIVEDLDYISDWRHFNVLLLGLVQHCHCFLYDFLASFDGVEVGLVVVELSGIEKLNEGILCYFGYDVVCIFFGNVHLEVFHLCRSKH